MLKPPFTLIHCSWPRPIQQSDGCWTSEPEWDAPAMPTLPELRVDVIEDRACWMIDWRDWFRGGLHYWQPQLGGEMREFHVVFHVQISRNGKLVFWDDDGCLIRRSGEVIHEDRASHSPARHEVFVRAGDRLEVAQWQYYGGWTWGACVIPEDDGALLGAGALLAYLDAVRQRLSQPNGPPLKVFCGGNTPIRSALSLYSMILNGYSPSVVLMFGEYQWSGHSRNLFELLFPFAKIIPNDAVIDCIQSLGQHRLVDLARRHFLVMKTCIGLFYPPTEYCLMDDDVFILDRVDDALQAFQQHNLVFAPDADYSRDYIAAWGNENDKVGLLNTGTFNAGLYWLRNTRDHRWLAADMLRVPPTREPTWQWEQGFIATRFADESTTRLPAHRYFYPYLDGLPGGMLGYDYSNNPCGFTSIHFGGLAEKPSDRVALALLPEILGRSMRCQ